MLLDDFINLLDQRTNKEKNFSIFSKQVREMGLVSKEESEKFFNKLRKNNGNKKSC